ncbi:MAG: Zn-dependent membrane protease YugP [Myxococcota bacterium]|jgi:Zn-dependent membrane protease YugP
MPVLIAALVLLAAVFGPGMWVRSVLARHHEPADRYPFSGAELARRLLDSEGLHAVRVEPVPAGDHYDPVDRVVRLTPANHDGRSLTAVTVAAHEVGHAVQHAAGFGPLLWRTELVQWVRPAERLGIGILFLAPLVLAFTRIPVSGVITVVGGLLVLGLGAAVHAVTLPTELDASFGRALPLLARERVLHPADQQHARTILTAAALTYLAASLLSLVNVGRWWAVLRR